MTLRFLAGAAIAVVLSSGMVMNPARAEADSISSACPAYPAHLHAAKERLTRGDRNGAVAELRRADEALASCLRQEAAGASLVAGRERPAPSS